MGYWDTGSQQDCPMCVLTSVPRLHSFMIEVLRNTDEHKQIYFAGRDDEASYIFLPVLTVMENLGI